MLILLSRIFRNYFDNQSFVFYRITMQRFQILDWLNLDHQGEIHTLLLGSWAHMVMLPQNTLQQVIITTSTFISFKSKWMIFELTMGNSLIWIV